MSIAIEIAPSIALKVLFNLVFGCLVIEPCGKVGALVFLGNYMVDFLLLVREPNSFSGSSCSNQKDTGFGESHFQKE